MSVDNGGRERGLKRVGLITAAIAAGGIVGTAAIGIAAHADTTSSATTTQHSSTSSGGSSSSDGSGSSGGSGSVGSGSGSVPQAQSSGS